MNTERNLFPDPFADHGFKKITPFNGFDRANPDNAVQNNYAWSMAEMGDYIYVGTARNIPYLTLSFYGLPVPEELTPAYVDMTGEIWRYKKDGSQDWKKVYKASPGPVHLGFRFMFTHTAPSGEIALYAAPMTEEAEVTLLKSTDGVNWITLRTGIPGNSTRSVIEHRGKLYLAALAIADVNARLYTSTDPEKEGWMEVDLAGDPAKNPRGNIDLLLSFKDRLYVGSGLPEGFEVWRTADPDPLKDNWKMVVDKGAGDALNEHPWAWGVFKDRIYLGTAIEAAVRSIKPGTMLVPPKGFDLIRIDPDDKWHLIAGGPPVLPTEPVTGKRGVPLSGFPSGFGSLSNAYCWQVQAHGNVLYLGTFDWSVVLSSYLPLLQKLVSEAVKLPYNTDNYLKHLENFLIFLFLSPGNPLVYQLPVSQAWSGIIKSLISKQTEKTHGFDLWKSYDGIRWTPVSLNGLGNPRNYGVRMLFLSSNDSLYLGTANPYQGCEVWVK